MFAVIKTGGKQYKVAADDQIVVMALDGEAGDAVTFGEVLSLGEGAMLEVGAPLVAGASVVGEIVAQKRGPKVIAFKKRRRQNSRRKRGHRQDLTVVKITELVAAGQTPGWRRTEAAEAVVDVPAVAAPEAVVSPEAGALEPALA